MENFIRRVTWDSVGSVSGSTVGTILGSVKSSLSSVTKREALAFKAGGWAGIPMEIAFEKVIAPQAEKVFGEKAFYNRISQFGSGKGVKRKRKSAPSKRLNSFSNRRNMPAKRSYRSANLEKRLRRVEARSKAEMKSITWTSAGTVTQGTRNVLDMTAIAEGTSVNERIGDKIKVWRIEIRGYADGEIDHYLIQKHGTDTPVYTDFGSGSAAFIADSLDSTKYTEWAWIKNLFLAYTNRPIIHYIHKFPMGIVVDFEGSGTTAVDNGLLLVSRNASTVDKSQSLSVRMWYTDK